MDHGRKSVGFADHSEDTFEQMVNRTVLADALYQAGQEQEAEALFREAEALQIKSQPQFGYLYSLWGYRFCELLLDEGAYDEVFTRATQTLESAIEYSNLLSIALDRLSLARVAMAGVGSEAEETLAMTGMLDRAVGGLRDAGVQHHLPRGLLARADWYGQRGLVAEAARDSVEAREIAERGEMRLFLVDVALGQCRAARAAGEAEAASGYWDEARGLIEVTGYHRRDETLAALAAGME